MGATRASAEGVGGVSGFDGAAFRRGEGKAAGGGGRDGLATGGNNRETPGLTRLDQGPRRASHGGRRRSRGPKPPTFTSLWRVEFPSG